MSEQRNAMHLDYEARVEAHRKATGVDVGVHSHDPRTEQALSARIDEEADVVSPKWDQKLEAPAGTFYSTDGRWGLSYEDLASLDFPTLNETPEERTARLSGVPPLGTPPGYGNHPLDELRAGMGPHMTEMNGALPVLPMQEVIARAVHNSPPPLDDVGGIEDELFDPEDPNHPAFDNDIPEFDPDMLEPLPIYEGKPGVSGVKHDTGKRDIMHLVIAYFPRALEEIALVSEAGAKQYCEGGWKTVPDGVRRYSAAMLRHILKVAKGKMYDEEMPGKIRHRAQIAWNALAALELELQEMEDWEQDELHDLRKST